MKSKRTDYKERQGLVRRLVGITLLPIVILATATPIPGIAQDARGLRYENAPDRTGNIVTITAPITTEFGTYVPYRVPKYIPAVGRYEGGVRSDLTNVILPDESFSWSYFSNAERGMLARDQVVIRAEQIGSFAQAYNGSTSAIPPFITVDAALGGLRSTLQEAYDQVRRDRLAPDLDGVLTALSRNVAGGLGGESSDELRDGLGRLLAWLETGRSLLDPSVVPDSRVASIVAAELERVERGGRAESDIFGRELDYRRMNGGSIDESGDLNRYVAAVRWLSEAGPRLGESDEEGMMAALMARMVDALDQRSRERLSDIIAVESFFSGADDKELRLDAIAGGMRSWYGVRYDGGYGFLGEADAVEQLRAYMAKYSSPGVADRMQTGLLPSESRTGEGMIALAGSGAKMVEGLKSKGAGGFASTVASIPAEGWVRSNDGLAFYTASILAEKPAGDRNLPSFMQSDTWTERRGESAIGAFTGFLAPSGVINVRSSGIEAGSPATRSEGSGFVGYVEPDPAAWAAVASYAGYVRDGLVDGRRGRMIDRGLERKLQDIENMSAQFTAISSAELAGTSLSPEQRSILASAPEHIAAWETPLASQGGLQITAGSAAVGGNGGAVGHPKAIYVLVSDATGEYFLTRGAVYDYRDASEPTDAWVAQLTDGNGEGSLPLDAFRAIDGRITEVTEPLQKTTSRATSGAIQLELESNVIRRTAGAVWFTIRADGYDRSNVIATVVDQSGRTVYTSRSMRIENGERLDMIPTEDLRSGQYFIRISDLTDRILASGRFMVVR